LALPKTPDQLARTLAGLLVPVSIRVWLRDLIEALLPSYAGMVRGTAFTLTAVGQTPVTIPFTGGDTAGAGARFITNLPAGQITRIEPGATMFGAQVTIQLPTLADVIVELFKNGVETVYQTQIQTDNKALTSTFVLTGIAIDAASATYSLRVKRVTGTSNLVVDYATFYATLP